MHETTVVKKAVIPAAGLGTRFLPASKAIPKEMFPVVDKPAIQYIVEEAVKSGIDDIIIVTGKDKTAIENHFDRVPELYSVLEEKGKKDWLKQLQEIDNLADIYYIRQKEPLGLGHAVLCAKKHIGNEPFAVLLGDDLILSDKPALKNLINVYEKHNSSVLCVQKVSKSEIPKFGIIKYKKVNGQIVVEGMVEKPAVNKAPSDLAIVGRYLLKPEIFGILEEIPFGKGNELQLTDGLRILNEIDKLMAYEIQDGQWLTVGDKMSYLKANIEYALKRPEMNKELSKYLKNSVDLI
ncbi:MAG: UTP--glucose-1-phosphate uridylyltransferase [Candidatus Diapherotrites archaeon CG10_big_fil_rev_8_21_14_0_10_31_34]|nr:MAG: UTP--glucose-1-phosphate uridylyltransferase [Candidatus Diapherotrites archaeon CG10_big_fil_rev_8_21_14_0_10_31_34]